MADDLFGLFPTGKWEVEGVSVYFAVEEIAESYANRLVEHERPYREGARLDDTFSKARVWRVTIGAYNSDDFPPEVSSDFYPTELNKLLDSFEKHETGTLTTNTRGPRRCRAESYERVEANEARDSAAVVLLFKEDNEDDASASDFTAPTAAAVAKKQANDAERAAEEEGVSLGNLAGSIAELGAGIEGLMNAPGDFVGDIEAQANSITHSVEKVEGTFAKTSEESVNEVDTLMSNPSASRAGRLHRQIADTAQKAASAKVDITGRKVLSRTFAKDLNLFVAAASLNNTAPDVLLLNPTLDPFEVIAGTPVKYYERP